MAVETVIKIVCPRCMQIVEKGTGARRRPRGNLRHYDVLGGEMYDEWPDWIACTACDEFKRDE